MADTDAVPAQGEGADPSASPNAIVNFWLGQIDAYDQEFKDWKDQCKQIVRRYRDERSQTQDGAAYTGGPRFNALWSNVQTLFPAVYAKAAQPVVERRYLDKDQMARYASMTLERGLEVQIEVGYQHEATRQAVLDYLLFGRGVTWERYEPTYGEAEDVGQTVDSDKSTDPAQDQPGEAARPVTYEKVCTDYISYDKFRHSPANIWDDVWWVAKEEAMTRRQLRDRFKEIDEQTGKPIADLIPTRDLGKDKETDREKKKGQPRAVIQEIWNKRDRQVIFIAPDWTNGPVEIVDDPLNLQDFWPVQKPLYATLTNDSLVPIPDYVEYKDQAIQLDNLTARIGALIESVRVNGVYDASYPELKRIFQEGVDNRMVGVKNYAEFAQKGGLEKALDFVPIKDIVDALVQLYDARERTKVDMAEVTGISDIVRGQAQGAAKTATEQRIKGQFATLRLEDRKKEVARFVRDGLRIKAEIISEQFAPEILAEMTGMIAFIIDELQTSAPAPQQSPMMGHNGGPPMEPVPAGGSPQPAPPPVPIDEQALQQFVKACELLRNDKMRTFRIDIETDSTVEVDRQAAKEAVVEMFTAVGGFMEKAAMLGMQMPQLVPALCQSILYAFRVFNAGRDVEGVWESAIDELTKMAKNPPPKQPSPEEVKAQAEIQKQQMEGQRMQEQAQIDQQKAQQDMEMAQQKNAMEIERMQIELQLKREELELKRQEMQLKQQGMVLDAQIKQQTAAMDMENTARKAEIEGDAMEREAQIGEQQAERDAEMGERQHEQSLEVMDAKTKQAKQQASIKAKASGREK